HMEVGRVLEGRRGEAGSMASGMLTPSTSGKLFISNDGNEIIAILNEAPSEPDKVLGVWRRVYLPPLTVSSTEAIAALRERYGAPTETRSRAAGGSHHMWRDGGAHSCLQAHRSAMGGPLAATWLEDGKQPDIKQSDGRPMPDAALPLLYRQPDNGELRQLPPCGPVLSATLNFE